MTTELLQAVLAADLNENEALNLLQEAGAISDECLTLEDIAEADCEKAIQVLRLMCGQELSNEH